MPDRALTIGEIEAFWKIDRYRLIVNRRCGERMLAWYQSLRANWK